MRFDKLTTKFQQALAEAQSIALGNDSGFVEPQHLLSALLDQDDAGTASLLARAGVNVPALKTALAKAIAFKQCHRDAQAQAWAAELIRLLECADIIDPARIFVDRQ